MSYQLQMAMTASRSRRYRIMNADKKRESNRRYYLANKELCIAAGSRWRKKNWTLVKIQIKCRASGLRAPSIAELRAGI